MDESGAIIVLWLFLFLSMIVIVGMAVDAMRTETKRVKLQQTLDSAVLAAADLDQPNEGYCNLMSGNLSEVCA